jgi:hypothetical protein
MSGGGRRRKGKRMSGGSNPVSYGYALNTSGGSDDVSLYRGGYPPISIMDENKGMLMGSGSNSNVSLQLGGKGKRGGRSARKMKSMRLRRKSKNGGKHKTHKHGKYCKCYKCRHKYKSMRNRKSRNKGGRRGVTKNPFKMTKKILEKIVGGNGTCGASVQVPNSVQSGGYSQYLGGQEFSQGYTLNDLVTPQTSALANPMPFKPYNSCQ